ncbi:MAG: hypothetical protein ACM31C_29240 [Acidobacteriota bacterium]
MKFALLLALAACGRLHFGQTATDAPSGDGTLGDGAGSATAFRPTWTSGTRFRARLWTPGDGSDPIFAGWRDTMLDTDCVLSAASDGKDRCMPNHTRGDQYYADAACTVPLAWIESSPCGHDGYAYFLDATSLFHELPIGAVYTGPVYKPGPCTPTTAPATGTLYSTGAEVPASAFGATRYSSAVVGKYTHEYAGYSDGSNQDLGVLSFNRGSCRPDGGVASGVTHCMPSSDPVLVPVYGDAGCSQRVYYSAAGTVPSPEFIVDETALCGPSYTLYEVVANVTTASYWTLGATGCAMQATGTGTLFTANAHDIYPTGSVAPDARTGRLGTLYWTADDGIPMPLANWDHDLNRSCWPFIAQDGAFRCLPRQAKNVTAYPDATCAGTAQTVLGNCYGLDPVLGPTYPSCDDGPWTVKTVGPLAGVSYQDEATCSSLGSAYDATATTGTQPPAMFVQLTEVIE